MSIHYAIRQQPPVTDRRVVRGSSQLAAGSRRCGRRWSGRLPRRRRSDDYHDRNDDRGRRRIRRRDRDRDDDRSRGVPGSRRDVHQRDGCRSRHPQPDVQHREQRRDARRVRR
ncbi:hypothetical protein BRC82_06655 [Halobacteriales archaeon QS_1_67_19]|nr:MAG: hypothetical protein BRC82_06655 [Halobacteriales archaeon QS_1_67_19]